MYDIVNNSTGSTESMTEREAVTKYGSDKVNAMLFGLDPDMYIHNSDADLDPPFPDNAIDSDFL